ncbi:hypothetical protein FHS10_002831 [Mucilaginibacter dorajii]|nr:hypothetical protein [Mucilaginibacter dorajii]
MFFNGLWKLTSASIFIKTNKYQKIDINDVGIGGFNRVGVK